MEKAPKGLIESESWMKLSLQAEAEVNAAERVGDTASSLLNECVKAAIDASELFARQSGKPDFFRQAIQSVRCLGYSPIENPRALAESIVIGVVFENPLDIAIQVSDLQLVASFSQDKSSDESASFRATTLVRVKFDELVGQLFAPSGL